MRFSKIKLVIVFLTVFLYSCSSLQLSPYPLNIEVPIATVSLASPSYKSLKTELLLLKSLVSQEYYLSDPSKSGMLHLDIPANTRGLAMSPNGQMVAFILNENSVLYLYDISSRKTNILIDSVEFQPGIGLEWSPDNQKIVFSCGIQGTLGLSLCLVDIKNKKNVQILVTSESLKAVDIFDGAISPSWSDDGQKIVFLSSTTPPFSGGKITSTKDIWLFDFSISIAKLIFPNETEGISHIFKPVFLSKNNSILFSGRKGKFNTIFDYKIDAKEIQNITRTDNDFDLVDFVLSPDGKSVLVNIPFSKNSSRDFVPTLYSFDGYLLKQLDFFSNFQVISWSIQ